MSIFDNFDIFYHFEIFLKLVLESGVEWTGTGADHALVWATKDLKTQFRRKRMTRKRLWEHFTQEKLEEEADFCGNFEGK